MIHLRCWALQAHNIRHACRQLTTVAFPLTRVASAISTHRVGDDVTVTGWVRTCRLQKTYSFMQVNDGTSTKNLQVLWASGSKDIIAENVAEELSAGCSVTVRGRLVASPKPAQPVELQASSIVLHGTSDALRYPLMQKKEPSPEYLRNVAHLRPRTSPAAAVLRVRHTVMTAIHDFFDARDFYCISTPILTSNDCEGAGELFSVLPAEALRRLEGHTAGASHQRACSATGSTAPPPAEPTSSSFFGKPVFLTVSGQLHLEAFACSMGRVYTVGPTFRAENSNTPRHLAEFWMLEAEVAPGTLSDAMDVAEACVRHVAHAVLNRRSEEVDAFAGTVKARLSRLASEVPFTRMSYSEAVQILSRSSVAWRTPLAWDAGLATEHERWLSDVHVGGPLFVHDYPATIKPFYMRQNEEGDGASGGPTVASFDLLVPGIGELVGGSAREERFDILASAMASRGLLSPSVVDSLAGAGGGRATAPADSDNGTLDWYLDTRKYGSMPHAGWGLGVERLVMLATGMDNIRDAIPMPRVPGGCRF